MDIQIHIPRYYFGVRFGTRVLKRSLPASFNEISRERLTLFLRLLIRLPLEKAKTRILYILLKLPNRYFERMSSEQVVRLLEQIDWMQLEPNSRALLPEFIHKGKRYQMTSSDFGNGTAMQYALADDFYKSYLENKQESDLRALVATLATAEDEDTIKSRGDALSRSKSFEDLDEAVVMSVLLYYGGCKQRIFEAFGDTLFKPEGSGGGGKPPQFGWWGIFMEIAESGTFGRLDQVHQSNFITLAMYLAKKKTEADEYRRKMQQQNQVNKR